MAFEIEVVDDPARACSAILVGVAAGAGHIVLTGGSTPRGAYEAFADAVRTVDVDISQATFWFGDERCVAPEDERSNYRLAKESILDPLIGRPAPSVHRMRGELGPHEGAGEYQRELEQAGPPHFDLLLLGIGPDGHCASLFPDQPTVSERSRLVVGVEQAGLEPYVPRISFTFTAISRAKHVVVLATGKEKAHAIAAAFGPEATPEPHVPSSFLPVMARELTVLIDPAAAAQLGPRAAGGSVRT